MKELSIEEKAKAYDEAIKKGKQILNTPYTAHWDIKEIVEHLLPKLKESEDERIRKRLTEYFEGYYDRFATDRNHVNVHWEGLEVKEILAWLKKQSKGSPVLSNSSNTGKSSWSEEDDEMLDSIIEEVRYIGDFPDYPTKEENELYDECLAKVEWLKSLKDRVQLQSKQEWSEEDVAMIKTLVAIFEVNYSNGFYKVNPIGTTNMQGIHSSEIIKWLKSLKDKVLPQPKQEWSKEDERIRIETIELLETTNHPNKMHSNGKPLDFTENINWLKSLRPQNRWISIDKEVYVKEPILAQKKDKSDTFGGFVVCCDHTLTPNVYERYMILGNIVSQNTWKPSDEQMEALKSSTYCQNEQMSKVLFELYQDLKKLREE